MKATRAKGNEDVPSAEKEGLQRNGFYTSLEYTWAKNT